MYPFGPAAEVAGVACDAAYLVRPDTYVALADREASIGTLAGYFASRDLTPAGGGARNAHDPTGETLDQRRP